MLSRSLVSVLSGRIMPAQIVSHRTLSSSSAGALSVVPHCIPTDFKFDESLLNPKLISFDSKPSSPINEHSFGVTDPSTNAFLCRITPPASPSLQMTEAIDKASSTFATFSMTTSTYRSSLLTNWAKEIRSNKLELAKIMTAESGKVLRESLGEIDYATAFLDYYAGEALRSTAVGGGEFIPSPFGQPSDPQQSRAKLLSLNTPVGPCAFLTPWNFPMAMLTRKVAPAFAAGCTAVVKPSELTPMTAIALEVLARKAGVPEGAFQVICCNAESGPAIGQIVCTNDMIKKISFTGSTRVGKELLRLAAGGDVIKRMSLELGGNAPFVVFADADMQVAVTSAINSRFRNAGQTCVCADRFIIHEDVVEEFAKLLVVELEKFKVGRGIMDETKMGPLISDRALVEVDRKVQDAIKAGAQLMTGGKKLTSGDLGFGNFYPPTVLKNCRPTDEIFCTETFGPVVAITTFKTDDEALALANSGFTGLAGYFFTTDFNRKFDFSARIHCGMVGVNEGIISYAGAPFGGVGSSGIGREGGADGIMEYIEKKYVVLN